MQAVRSFIAQHLSPTKFVGALVIGLICTVVASYLTLEGSPIELANSLGSTVPTSREDLEASLNGRLLISAVHLLSWAVLIFVPLIAARRLKVDEPFVSLIVGLMLSYQVLTTTGWLLFNDRDIFYRSNEVVESELD